MKYIQLSIMNYLEFDLSLNSPNIKDMSSEICVKSLEYEDNFRVVIVNIAWMDV